MIPQSQSYYFCHIKKLKVLVLMIAILLFNFSSANGEPEEANMQLLHIASTENYYLLSLGESVYYLENHQNLLSSYTILYRINNDRLTKIATFSNYGLFAGIYHGKAVIRLTESSYTNYPTYIRYILYNPTTGLEESMPESVTKLLQCNSHVMLRGYGDCIIINLNGVLYSYGSRSDQLKTIDDYPFEFVNLASTFCFAMRNEDSYYYLVTEDSIQVSKVKNTLPTPKLWFSGTHSFFCFTESQNALIIEERDILDDDIIIPITEKTIKSNSLLVLSADLLGDFLYIVTRSSVERYDLQLQAIDHTFDYRLKIPDKAYIADIIIYENRIIYVVHNNSQNDIYIDYL